jgi:hypothetical protein
VTSVLRSLIASDDDKSEEALLRHVLRASKLMLRVATASEALALLTRSRRTWQDYTLALKHPGRWNQHLAVRPGISGRYRIRRRE